MVEHVSGVMTDTDGDILSTGEEMARQLARGFQSHDVGDTESAIEAFKFIDKHQFQAKDEEDICIAATAFVEALIAKDDVELNHLTNGELDQEGIRNADYGVVRQKLRKRAAVLGIESAYASARAEAWRQHKAGGDYWTPFLQSQVYELRAALENPDYPEKPRAGHSGPGPEPIRYLLAFESHDMKSKHYWEQGEKAMVPYFVRILEHYEASSSEDEVIIEQ